MDGPASAQASRTARMTAAKWAAPPSGRSSRVTEVMTEDVVQVEGDVRLFEVVRLFKEREIGRLIVIEEGRPVGILTKTDIIRVFPPS
ncbi:CBS domain protein [anaerobic digester metagenome]